MGTGSHDDVTERFRKFLRVTFGEEHFQENLRFIETALGKDIRKYFTKDFYKDHVKRYKKRPIYWMFSSPKGSFNALIYMHRYNRDTVSVLLDQYVREFKVKLNAQKSAYERVEISSDASQGEKDQGHQGDPEDQQHHRGAGCMGTGGYLSACQSAYRDRFG